MKKSDSNQRSLATASILGQPPSAYRFHLAAATREGQMIETERLIDERIAPGAAWLAPAREHNLALSLPCGSLPVKKV